MACAGIWFQKEEQADPAIEEMLNQQDAILRYGAALMIGMAYCGTSQAKAIKKLLHVISTDVSDDVKRAAVMALGFVFVNNHTNLPKILNLLAQSYNAHIRYGVAMALGISGAGKAHSEAIKMVQPMLNDTVDFVR